MTFLVTANTRTVFTWSFLLCHTFMSSVYSETEFSSAFSPREYLYQMLTFYSLCAKDDKGQISLMGATCHCFCLGLLRAFSLFTFLLLPRMDSHLLTDLVGVRVINCEEKALILAKLLRSFHFLVYKGEIFVP